MFRGVRGKKARIDKIIRALTNYQKGYAHHLHLDGCIRISLKIKKLEGTHKPGYENGSLATFAIVLRDGPKLIGAIGLTLDRDVNKGELG